MKTKVCTGAGRVGSPPWLEKPHNHPEESPSHQQVLGGSAPRWAGRLPPAQGGTDQPADSGTGSRKPEQREARSSTSSPSLCGVPKNQSRPQGMMMPRPRARCQAVRDCLRAPVERHGLASILWTVVRAQPGEDRRVWVPSNPVTTKWRQGLLWARLSEVARNLLTSELESAVPWRRDAVCSSLAKPQRTSALGREGSLGSVHALVGEDLWVGRRQWGRGERDLPAERIFLLGLGVGPRGVRSRPSPGCLSG
uniref:Uncharacterized protein n=1 Tax=Molossus molossus TaxID=27622 RepID=A0A7J8CZC2_MOLMO|nr:hypothetical protein HJG59_009424 [Molossus molossus]